MAQVTALGTVRGSTIELEAPVSSLEGRRVRVLVEPAPEELREPTAAPGEGRFGCAASVVRIRADFDAPLTDFANYER